MMPWTRNKTSRPILRYLDQWQGLTTIHKVSWPVTWRLDQQRGLQWAEQIKKSTGAIPDSEIKNWPLLRLLAAVRPWNGKKSCAYNFHKKNQTSDGFTNFLTSFSNLTKNISKKSIDKGIYVTCKLINNRAFFSSSGYLNSKHASSFHVYSTIISLLMRYLDVHPNIYRPPLISSPMKTLHFTTWHFGQHRWE